MAARKKKKKLTSDQIRKKIKLKLFETELDFKKKYPEISIAKIREQSSKLLGMGALAGSLLLSPPTGAKPLPPPRQELLPAVTPRIILTEALKEILPERVQSLARSEEKQLERTFEEIVGVKTKATLEGEHLNTTYGLIGAEQHLRRFPGDTLSQHSPTQEMLKEGIAPGLGAWGYFAPSKQALTQDLIETEKWYAVVQTLYLPDWAKRQPYLRNWYKYRKVLIVNTDNGRVVVASIADAGPAAWTGKHFGGSPEVMDYLGGPRYKKGPVVLFFVDDPENLVPLGPVEYNKLI